ncbi:MAG: plastocyanin/azurin family copper-binding protein [Piscinibacter sp.]
MFAADEAATVSIREMRFEPAALTVKAGSTVRWSNDEKRSSHSVLFKGEGGLESDRLLPGEQWQRRFDKPGRYPYVCGPHPEMAGVIEVQP